MNSNLQKQTSTRAREEEKSATMSVVDLLSIVNSANSREGAAAAPEQQRGAQRGRRDSSGSRRRANYGTTGEHREPSEHSRVQEGGKKKKV